MNEENNVKNKKKDTITNYIIVGLLILVVIGVIIKNNMNKNNNGNIDNEKSNIQGYVPKAENVNIKESEVSKITLEDYSTDLFSIKKPKGWKVDTIGDCIHYTIKVYDPQRPTYQFFFNLKTEGYNKSEDAKAWQKRYYPNDMFAKNPVISEKTTEGFYKIFSELGPLNNTASFTFPTLSNFTVVDKIGYNNVDNFKISTTVIEKTELLKERIKTKTTVQTTSLPPLLDTDFCYITENGKKFHRENCRYLYKSNIKIIVKEAKEKGFSPCSVCKPQ